jgi:hypothetical protein
MTAVFCSTVGKTVVNTPQECNMMLHYVAVLSSTCRVAAINTKQPVRVSALLL